MSLVINNNMMAANAARTLNAHYGKLANSTNRLSSGLRINSAADDAAGLAIRELQRADIATLRQGARNANDAVSLIQTADGALQIIDEKLIRMKELAEQAATGTYDSIQRLMIESEYQAMASEITRIAKATDFNGIHLLNGNLEDDEHDGSGLVAKGKMKIHFGTGNDSAEDYYYIQIAEATSAALGIGDASTWEDATDRLEKTFQKQLEKHVQALNANPAIADDIKQAIAASAEQWKKDFRTALESYVPPTAEIAARFASHPEVSALGDFPTDYAAQPDRVKQRWEYAIGHAVLDSLDLYRSPQFTSPDYPGITATYSPPNRIEVNDSNTNATIKTAGGNTVKDEEGNILTFNGNGQITNIATDTHSFSRNVANGHLAYRKGTDTFNFNDQGDLLNLVDGAGNTVDFNDNNTAKAIHMANGESVSLEYDSHTEITSATMSQTGTIFTFESGVSPSGAIGSVTATTPVGGKDAEVTYTAGAATQVVLDKDAGKQTVTYPLGTGEFTVSGGTYRFDGTSIPTDTAGKLTYTSDNSANDKDNNTLTFNAANKVTRVVGASRNAITTIAGSSYTVADSDRNATITYDNAQPPQITRIVRDGKAYTDTAAYIAEFPDGNQHITDSENALKSALNAADMAEAGHTARQLHERISATVEAMEIGYGASSRIPDDLRSAGHDAADDINDAKTAVALYSAITQTLNVALREAASTASQYTYAGYTIATQDDAQIALDALNEAIQKKDKIRAHLGAVQNRLENTISNLNIQAENLQAAESRISDVDVATEMTEFVRQQILAQSAVAMLSQANTLPKMAMQLIGG